MEDTKLTPEERKTLLAVARAAIAKKLGLSHAAPDIPDSPGLASRSGTFVTLTKKGNLRGCIASGL
ncbi:MAG: AMMECR1 domain-containing protein [Deltaproteobacteria bacterium]|nr:AMMECR1 domain-containing protein [Deltaproteobacteria bacterium]